MVKIKREFKNLIPPLKPEEYAGLEKSLQKSGCLDTLKTWNDFIIDGHNRLDICEKHNIEYKTEFLLFDNQQAVEAWIIDNQLARRNISDFVRYELVQKKADLLREKGHENLKIPTGGNKGLTLSTVDKVKHDTRQEIANTLNWSTGKTAQADIVNKHADEKTKNKLRSGEVSINQVYKDTKKGLRQKETWKERNKLAESGAKVKFSKRWNVERADIATYQTDKRYDFIITDPPYPREFLPLYETLGQRARQWLKPDGLLLVMCGESYLDVIYKSLSEYLKYYWTACYYTPGPSAQLRTKKVNCNWKPILIYLLDGDYSGKIFKDVFISDRNEKDCHKWGQSVSGMNSIVESVCLPGQSIFDPFVGAGTTGIAALNHGCFFDGIDIDSESVNITKARLNECETKIR